VIPNFVDTGFLTVGNPENDYRRQHDLVGRTVIMYAGNVGLSQSLDLVVGAARALEHSHPEVCFVINGEGSGRAGLQRSAAGLSNIRFVDYQPKERLGEVLAAGDLHLVPLRRGLAHASVPSKLYSILAAGRPVLASVDPGTEVARTIDAAGAGVSVNPDDQEAFRVALCELLDRRADWAAMGAAGRSFVQGWASPAAVAAAYGALFHELRP
jgi:colanic acid biosynthesis glycosyl transferase WcaI